jgi:hypothetical protein
MSRVSTSAVGCGLIFLLAFALSVVMLLTDSNLRTNFGAMSSGYYFHWYIVLATAIADVVGALLLLTLRSRTVIKGGVAGSGLLILVLLGAILSYAQVGFASASDFANYLFGVTYYGGDIRYLYDALLAVYAAALGVGILAVVSTHPPSSDHGNGRVAPPASG